MSVGSKVRVYNVDGGSWQKIFTLARHVFRHRQQLSSR